MIPVDIHQANATLKGDASRNISDLKVLIRQYSDGTQSVTSEWRMSLFERIYVLFSGSVYVGVMTKDYPPIKVSIENQA